jgi:hypothetical protein
MSRAKVLQVFQGHLFGEDLPGDAIFLRHSAARSLGNIAGHPPLFAKNDSRHATRSPKLSPGKHFAALGNSFPARPV